MLTIHTAINNNEYHPDVVSAPGETLQEMLDDRGMTQTQFADRLGLTHKTVNEIIKGKAPISHETALALETVLGVPARFWNSFEAAYRESLAREQQNVDIARDLGWLQRIPWKEAASKGYFSEVTSPVDQLREVLRFFGVASPSGYDEVYRKVAVQLRTSASREPNPDALAFWLRMGEVLAAGLPDKLQIEVGDYDARIFERSLWDVRILTREPTPESFIKPLQKACALAGVIVVFVPELTGSAASGAARWLSPTRALIQLSLRYKTNDSLWFSFYHEAAHILKHSKKVTYLDEASHQQTADEIEADRFAQDFLISQRDFSQLIAFGRPAKADVEAFADRIGVHPGIVVGRLHNEKVIPQNWFNDLRQRYVWEFQR